MRDVLAHVSKTAQGMVAAFARTIWAQPDAAMAHAQLGWIAEHLRTTFLKAATTLLAAEEDALAHTVGHFLPYMWLHRTRAYAVLAVACALGPFAVLIMTGVQAAFHATGFLVGA